MDIRYAGIRHGTVWLWLGVQRAPVYKGGMRETIQPAEFRPGRRAVLRGLVAIGGALAHPGSSLASESPAIVLNAAAARQALVGVGSPETAIWAYDGTAPGPELRLKRGAPVHIRVRNGLPQPTTVHWHGLRIANAMDGVSGMTQDPIAPGAAFDYRFTPPDAGTFWYHPHHRSWEQVERGLYGALIVEEETVQPFDRDIVYVLDDWRLDDRGQLDERSFGNLGDWSHAGRLGNFLTVNGAAARTEAVRRGERLRCRLVNAATARVLALDFGALEPIVIAVDGQPVDPFPLPKGGPLLFGPAQRLDLLIDVAWTAGTAPSIDEVSGGGRYAVIRFETVGALSDGFAASPFPGLPANGLAEPEVGRLARFPLVMEGGAMGGLAEAEMDGKVRPLGDLAREHGLVWAFNGVAGMPRNPLFSVRRGDHVAIDMTNRTVWRHVIHLHGHHFRVISRNGRPPRHAIWHDSVLLAPEETVSIAFVADNPGHWMCHCHMLEHQAGGMSTWFEVA